MAQGGPELREIAHQQDGRDITRTFVRGLLAQPEDYVLRDEARGDWTLYQRLLRDDQVASTLQQRRTAVTSAEWTVDPGDDSPAAEEAADMLREQIAALEWDSICDKMLYGLFYGFAAGECMWAMRGNRIELADVRVRKPWRFRFDTEHRLKLLTRQQPLGMDLPDRKFWVLSTGASHSDDPYGIGLAHYLYWPVYFKRNGLRFWLVFLEKFGQPTATAKVPLGKMEDAQFRSKVLGALHAMQTDSAILIPEGVEFAFMEAARSGTADYATLQGQMDKAISKIVLSQTMTTDDGSSLAQAKVHADVAEEVKKSDADLLCGSFNRQVATWLTAWNFGEDEDGRPRVPVPRVWRRVEPEDDLNELAERDAKIMALGYEPTEDYIRETYGEGWIKKAEPDPLMLPPAGLGGQPTDFAEFAATLGHRQDQALIATAARELANQYPETIGDRVRELVALAEQTGDFETFRTRLAALAEAGPKAQTVEKIARAGVVGWLLGALRGER